MQRIYYHESKDAFYFAAEAKAILTVRPELRRLTHGALGEFVACGCVLENRTLFDGIQVLPPGSAWTFRGVRSSSKGTTFEPDEWEKQSPLDPEAYYQKLREVFSQNLPRYFNGSQPLAMSLTGGLDSRMILAWHKPSPGLASLLFLRRVFRDSQDVVLGASIGRSMQPIPPSHSGWR